MLFFESQLSFQTPPARERIARRCRVGDRHLECHDLARESHAEALPAGKRVTLGGDKNYDTQEFVRELRGMNITPHVAQNTTKRRSAVDERTTRHVRYEVSQRKRKRVEQSFGWMKIVGMLKKVKLRGIDKVGWLFIFTGAAYNLCRLRNMMAKA
jgi:Transposase DDE domain